MNIQRRGSWVVRAMAAIVAALVLTTGFSGAALAGDQTGPGIRFDFGIGWSTMDESWYSDARWSSGALVNVEEYWDIDFRGSAGPTFGGAFFYRFNPYVSVELEGRGLFTEPDTMTDYTIYWDWDDGRSLWNAYRGLQVEEAELWTMVGSLNLVAHLTDNGPVRPFLSFGFSAFDTEIRGARDTAYAVTYTDGTNQYLGFDYPVMDFRADANTLGFNVGAGGDLHLSRQVALTFMVKYYHSESDDVNLRVGGIGGFPELDGFVMEVDPSFWITTGGVKFLF